MMLLTVDYYNHVDGNGELAMTNSLQHFRSVPVTSYRHYVTTAAAAAVAAVV